MYKRNTQGWLKHIDFILWDVIVLQAAYVLGYMIRHGWGQWPYLQSDYKSLAIVLAVVDVMVAIIFSTMHNVMKRGAFKELTATIKHAALVLGIMSLYLFSTQEGDTYSRITIYLTAGFHLVLGYGIRLLWKPLIRRINKGKNKGTMILVAEENTISSCNKQILFSCITDGAVGYTFIPHTAGVPSSFPNKMEVVTVLCFGWIVGFIYSFVFCS